MAKLIEFYTPDGFRPQEHHAPEQCSGVVIEFRLPKAEEGALVFKRGRESQLKTWSAVFYLQKH